LRSALPSGGLAATGLARVASAAVVGVLSVWTPARFVELQLLDGQLAWLTTSAGSFVF